MTSYRLPSFRVCLKIFHSEEEQVRGDIMSTHCSN